MIDAGRVAAILLAAGRGTRFGADKLSWPVGGRPLGVYAARALLALPFSMRIAVTPPRGIRYDDLGFIRVENDHPELGMAHSIRLGVGEAQRRGADAVLIVLADMPFVPSAHLAALLARYRDGASIIASEASHPGPPVLFGRSWFSRLAALEGDKGAGAWLAGAQTVACETHWLLDIDTKADLAAF